MKTRNGSDNRKQNSMMQDRIFGVTMLVAGLAIAGVSYLQAGSAAHVLAQATQPSTPGNTTAPVDPTSGQSRPTTPAPEPARPQAVPDATPNSPNTTGSSNSATTPPAALPPAPAEKTGEPIKAR